MHPAYFGTSTLLAGALLATHLYFHPVLLRRAAWWGLEEGVQGLLILGAFVPQLVNWVAVGPRAIRLVYERHRAERTGKEIVSVGGRRGGEWGRRGRKREENGRGERGRERT